jgi:hypothetical protein
MEGLVMLPKQLANGRLPRGLAELDLVLTYVGN